MKYEKLARKHDPEIVAMINKLKFYEVSNEMGSLFSVCLAFGENGVLLSRGVSICSMLDGCKKQKGRNIAIGRAIRAIYHSKTSEPIVPEVRPLDETITRFIKKGDVKVPVKFPKYLPVVEAAKHFTHKSEYTPSFTKYEMELFEL